MGKSNLQKKVWDPTQQTPSPKKVARRRWSTPSSKRNGSTSKPPTCSSRGTSARPSSPRPSVTRWPLTASSTASTTSTRRTSRDKNCEMVRKKHTMISAHCDVKTTDNFQLRLFVVGFTAKDQKQVKGTTYCQSHQAKSIRKIMVDTMQKTASSGDIQNLVKNLLVDTIASDITKQVKSIYPLENVHVQKVKTIKRPKLDLGRLAELHGQSGVKTNAKGEKVERADHYEPAVQETV